MGCDCLTGMIRLIMFVINVGIWIAGAGLLGIGIWMLVDASTFDYLFTEDTLTVVAIITVTTGAVMFLVGFCGCCGAMKGNRCLLSTYVAILAILTVAMIATGITALVYVDQVEDYLEGRIQSIITDDYGNTQAATDTIDSLQKDVSIISVHQWLNTYYRSYIRPNLNMTNHLSQQLMLNVQLIILITTLSLLMSPYHRN
ncbi:CD81 antigen-like [Anneissia japonica]|uniref:CD81 antigen-like n=1 Tax=Anneissia japonica TaxID=1529436 RepID=UPI0014259BE5|nr:CD81 antigen-like [Anneissia japonica]